MPTTRELLDVGIARLRESVPVSGVETPRLDAELLLAQAIGVDRTTVIAHPDAPVGPGAEATYRAGIERRCAGEPVAYLRGIKEFHGLALAVDPRALIPRPETERLVDLAIAEVMRRLTTGTTSATGPTVQVVDVGTGSGAIAIALAVALRGRRVPSDEVAIAAVDISPDALDLARENAVGHGVGDRLRFVGGDLLPPLGAGPWDIVLANLPYVPTDVLPTLAAPTSFEPVLALDGGADGFAVIDRLLARLPTALAHQGVAMFEIGAEQWPAIVDHAAAQFPGSQCTIEPDLGGSPRVAIVRRPTP